MVFLTGSAPNGKLLLLQGDHVLLSPGKEKGVRS